MEAVMEKISPFYNDAVQQIKSAILESQLETARAANKQMLSLYYAVGKFVSENSREGTWGKGAIDTISAQLRREMPGLRGFSATNIKYMRIFYERWLPVINRQPTADELENAENNEKSAKIPIFALLNINRSPLANDLDFSEFLELSFTHHMEILLKTSTLEERAFYIHQAIINHWDEYFLTLSMWKNSTSAIPRILMNVLSKIPLSRTSRILS
jgi:predicted nuclease of restriction endonuclease-like (RecB) superfamily